MAEIIVTIDRGKSTVRVEGVSGPACRELTKSLEEKLGSVTSSEDTREYYEEEVHHVERSENRR